MTDATHTRKPLAAPAGDHPRNAAALARAQDLLAAVLREYARPGCTGTVGVRISLGDGFARAVGRVVDVTEAAGG